MSKPTLVRMSWTDLNSSYLEWILQEYFTLETYNLNKTYDRESTIFVVSRPEHIPPQLLENHIEKGYKLILANLWEARPFFKPDDLKDYLDNVLVILGCKNSFDYGWKNIVNIPNWFWYNESLWYSCDKNFAPLKNYQPNRTNNKKFFMPIRRQKPFRTQIVETLEPVLDDATWSYCERWMDGRRLVTDESSPIAHQAWDRQFNEEWYNDTYFSVAVETACGHNPAEIENQGIRGDQEVPCELFVTEKTFKPIAFRHPFQVLAMPGTLQFLKQNGFETYDHIFDESYDDMPFFDDRLNQVLTNIVEFDQNKYNDPLTEQKMEHNYQWFYNRDRVVNGIKQELIEPMLEWINQ
jgi:hypothetical protein